MNRTEMIQLVARREGVSQAVAAKIIAGFLEVTAVCLAAGEDVNLRGFGQFEPRTKRAVTRSTPWSDQPYQVPSKRTVRFTPSPVLKARLNESE